ncbi:hypothetical protein C2G38_2254613 [Gigaspora rosea]|uniref:Transposase putative helix-turn-helix domain-containing protein n=1 Tax=Gigaspora rosea TaxID=44941 RepID=A0A397U9R8_9GLOM|nr:hypothetical protein C2G38_2254613 [Gigaspora rosea]
MKRKKKKNNCESQKRLKPWALSENISSRLWLPIDTNINKIENNNHQRVNFVEGCQSWFNTTSYEKTIKSDRKYFVFEPGDDEDYNPDNVKEEKKIRLYPTPEEAKRLRTWIDGARWTYNQAVNMHFYHGYHDFKLIRQNCLNDEYIERNPHIHWLFETPREVRSSAIRQYKKAYQIQKKIRGKNFTMHYRSKKANIQSIMVLARDYNKERGFGDPETSVDDDDSVESSDSIDSHEFDSSYNSDESEELFFQVYSEDFFPNNSNDKVTSNHKSSKHDIMVQNNDSVGEGSSLQNSDNRKEINFPNEESIFQNINREGVVNSNVIRRVTFNNSNGINALQGIIKKDAYFDNGTILKDTSIKKNYSDKEYSLQNDPEHNIDNFAQQIADGYLASDHSEVSSQRSLDLLSDNHSSDFESLQDMLFVEAEDEEEFWDEVFENSIQKTSNNKTESSNETLNTEINNDFRQQLASNEDKSLEHNLSQVQDGDLIISSTTATTATTTAHSSIPLSYPLVVINSDASVPYITPSKSSMSLTSKASNVSSSGESSESPTTELSHVEFMSPPSPLSSKDLQDGERYDTRKKDKKVSRSSRSRNVEAKFHTLRSRSVKYQGSSNRQSRQGGNHSDHTRMKKNGMSLVCRN